MKKLLLVAILYIASVDANAMIVIGKCDGGSNGYKYVTETHQGGSDALSCTDPGNLKCEMKEPLRYSKEIYQDEIEGRIEIEIAVGNYNGTFESTNGRLVIYNFNAEPNCLIYKIED